MSKRLELPLIGMGLGNGNIIVDNKMIPIQIRKIVTDEKVIEYFIPTESEIKRLKEFYTILKEFFEENEV